MKKTLLAVTALIVLIIALPMLLPRPSADSDRPVEGLPWQIETLPDGNSRVFGLTLGSSTLADAQNRLGGEMKVAIVAAPGEPGTLEAYLEDVTAGAVTGKMVLTADIAPETLAGMRSRAEKSEYMQSSTKKSTLAAEDLPQAQQAPIAAIAFVPSINLDEQIILQRFGQPAERIRSSANTEHFLYPARGLDLHLDSEAKELLQYVPPRHFARLRDPLVNKP